MQKIVIDKFRQISHAEIELRDFVFLIGPQASGKSTIAKLIYLFKTLKREYISFFDNDELSELNPTKVCQQFIKNIQDKFAVYFGKTFFLDDEFSVTYYFSVEKKYYAVLSKKNGTLNIRFSDEQWTLLRNESYQLIGELRRVANIPLSHSTIYDEQRREKNISKKKLLAANEIFCDERDCLFLPAGRNITVSYPDQFQMLFYGELRSATYDGNKDNSIDIQLMRDFVSYSKLLLDYFSDQHLDFDLSSPFEKKLNNNILGILQGNYQNENGYEKIIHGDSQYFTPLSKASSGQQEVIRIIQDAIYILNGSLKTSRIIEEPETHLFPQAQHLLIQLLILVANKTSNQVIITTHSPHVLATFNNLLYYSRVLKQSDSKIKDEIERRFGTEGFDESKQERLNITIDKFQAYALDPHEDVYCKSIVDETTELIGENYIDRATENIYDEFDFLYSLIS